MAQHQKAFISLMVTAALVGSVGAVANGSPASAVPSHSVVSPSAQEAEYTDSEIVELFLFAQGRAAEDHPDLAVQVLRGTTIPVVEQGMVDFVTAGLIRMDPEFHATVTGAVQSQDPYLVKAALLRLTEDTNHWLDQTQTNQSPMVQARDWFYPKSNIAVMNQVAAAAVVAVTLAALVSVVGVFLALYSFDDKGKDQFTADSLVAKVVTAL
ncbi:hypothetical protein [Leifsonia sp. NPDC058230]|uniref:hypothetical protein n=1 Tax=Leifsonia sp. NPDC058230 TaxID=3346391 RepID=UPI0036DF869D